jgi:hypothetical protein
VKLNLLGEGFVSGVGLEHVHALNGAADIGGMVSSAESCSILLARELIKEELNIRVTRYLPAILLVQLVTHVPLHLTRYHRSSLRCSVVA